MGIPHSVTKGPLTAGAANNIAASQSPGAGTIILNGTTSNRVSTTTTAAAAAGSLVLALTTVAGIVAGSAITDSTTAAIPSGTTVLGVDATNSKVILSQPVGDSGVGSGDTIVIGGVATLDTQRRVLITSGASDAGITFTINGAGDNGVPISDTFAGGAISALSNLDFKTITSITHTGSVAGTITIGTTTNFAAGVVVAATPWFGVNWHAQPVNIELSGIVTGTVTWGWQYTYDDPNNLPPGILFPQPFFHPTLNNITVSQDGAINDPVAAVRLVIISAATNTGSVRGTWMEAGISGQ